jgi:hypothetical protein
MIGWFGLRVYSPTSRRGTRLLIQRARLLQPRVSSPSVSTPVSVYLTLVGLTFALVAVSPGTHLRILANATSSEKANLWINLTATALIRVDGGEVARVVATISCSSGL